MTNQLHEQSISGMDTTVQATMDMGGGMREPEDE